MTRKSYLYLLLTIAAVPMLPGCAVHRQAYYVSPFNGNTNEYHTLPTHIDAHSALYASLSFAYGQTNDLGTDHFKSVNTSIYAAHQYGFLQFHYGTNLNLGSYSMGKWAMDTMARGFFSYYSTGIPHWAQLNTYSGQHFFGGVGFQAGVNGCLPMDRSEWRFLGVETSLTQEFGNYLSTRKQIPDSIATLVNRNPLFATIGLNTEIVVFEPHGDGGARLALGWALGPAYSNPGIFDTVTEHYLHFTYFNLSFHYTYRQLTGYFQVTNATKSLGWMFGINYRLLGGRKERIVRPDR